MAECEALAARLERMAEWQVGLRPAERADLRRAAAIIRSSDDVVDIPSPVDALTRRALNTD